MVILDLFLLLAKLSHPKVLIMSLGLADLRWSLLTNLALLR